MYKGESLLAMYWEYTYNRFGDLVQELEVNTPNGPGIALDERFTGGAEEFTLWPNDTSVFKLKYDSLDHVVERVKYVNSKIREKNTYHFPGDSSVHILVKYSPYDGTPDEIITTTESGARKVVFGRHLNREGEERSWYKYIYKDGQLVELEAGWQGYKHHLYKTEYEYDPRGNWVKKIQYKDNKKESIVERKIKYL